MKGYIIVQACLAKWKATQAPCLSCIHHQSPDIANLFKLNLLKTNRSLTILNQMKGVLLQTHHIMLIILIIKTFPVQENIIVILY